MFPVFVYAAATSAFAASVVAGLKSLNIATEVRDPALFNPNQRDPNRGVVVDAALPNAEVICKAYTGTGARVVVAAAGADSKTLASGLGLIPAEPEPAVQEVGPKSAKADKPAVTPPASFTKVD